MRTATRSAPSSSAPRSPAPRTPRTSHQRPPSPGAACARRGHPVTRPRPAARLSAPARHQGRRRRSLARGTVAPQRPRPGGRQSLGALQGTPRRPRRPLPDRNQGRPRLAGSAHPNMRHKGNSRAMNSNATSYGPKVSGVRVRRTTPYRGGRRTYTVQTPCTTVRGVRTPYEVSIFVRPRMLFSLNL